MSGAAGQYFAAVHAKKDGHPRLHKLVVLLLAQTARERIHERDALVKGLLVVALNGGRAQQRRRSRRERSDLKISRRWRKAFEMGDERVDYYADFQSLSLFESDLQGGNGQQVATHSFLNGHLRGEEP